MLLWPPSLLHPASLSPEPAYQAVSKTKSAKPAHSPSKLDHSPSQLDRIGVAGEGGKGVEDNGIVQGVKSVLPDVHLCPGMRRAKIYVNVEK